MSSYEWGPFAGMDRKYSGEFKVRDLPKIVVKDFDPRILRRMVGIKPRNMSPSEYLNFFPKGVVPGPSRSIVSDLTSAGSYLIKKAAQIKATDAFHAASNISSAIGLGLGAYRLGKYAYNRFRSRKAQLKPKRKSVGRKKMPPKRRSYSRRRYAPRRAYKARRYSYSKRRVGFGRRKFIPRLRGRGDYTLGGAINRGLGSALGGAIAGPFGSVLGNIDLF